MALSRIEGQDNLYVGGLWALRRSDTLVEKGITHVLSVVGFSPNSLKNFKDEPWSVYGQQFRHLVIDIDDVDDANLLVELPRAMRFIHGALDEKRPQPGGVFVHCAAGKSRSVSVVVAYLLWRCADQLDLSKGSTPSEAVEAALALVRRTRPMAEPNDGFMHQLALWWEMGCPSDVETHPIYQRWAYKREVDEHVAIGQAPARLRFEDEDATSRRVQQQQQQQQQAMTMTTTTTTTTTTKTVHLRCKKCRRTLATTPFIISHVPTESLRGEPCPHYFIEPLSWMRPELERGQLNGRFACPNARCGAAVGRYDWKGLRCACRAWVTPGLSLQRARVDEEETMGGAKRPAMGIRMPPGGSGGGGNL